MDPAGERIGCPKRMVFGPCGGVRDDERCEVGEHRCVFLDGPPVRWSGPPVAPAASSTLAAAEPPVVLADLSVPPFQPATLRRVVGTLGPAADALLVGAHADRPDPPPTMFAAVVL
jgi:hypothetical protein